MAFSYVRPDSETWLARARSADARVADAPRAVTVLRADYERWSRLLLGVVAHALAVACAFLTITLTGALTSGDVPLHIVDVGVLVVAAALTVVGTLLLVRLWRSGRRLTAAAAWWIAFPYRSGVQRPSAIGWWQARAINLEPRILIRVITATAAMLVGLFGASAVIFAIVEDRPEGETAFTVAAGVAGLISLAAACGQYGGVLRLVNGYSAGDAVWRRIVGWRAAAS